MLSPHLCPRVQLTQFFACTPDTPPSSYISTHTKYMYMCVYRGSCICTYTNTYTCTLYTHMHMHVDVHLHTHTHKHIIYIYIYVHIHMCIYIYIVNKLILVLDNVSVKQCPDASSQLFPLRSHTAQSFFHMLEPICIGSRVTDAYAHAYMCSYLGPFDTPHARGSFAPRARERDRLINRLLRTDYVFVYAYPFSFPSVPRPMGGGYIRVAYSVASVHFTRGQRCTRRISLATRNYKLIRNQHVSPSMTGETSSSPLVLAKAIEFRCTVQKENAD